mmetsp:Transcript_73023/g.136398  ORF Transcript_73023/g.136398 Transcript_73023/m.136398 type:complete len:126 (+) Transcript_73023:1101-1478(+)
MKCGSAAAWTRDLGTISVLQPIWERVASRTRPASVLAQAWLWAALGGAALLSLRVGCAQGHVSPVVDVHSAAVAVAAAALALAAGTWCYAGSAVDAALVFFVGLNLCQLSVASLAVPEQHSRLAA